LKMKNNTRSQNQCGEAYKPVRMCAACKKREEKDRLIRIVKDLNDTAEIDWLQNTQKRGAYLCRNEECVMRAKKTRALARSLHCGVEDEIYEQIIRSINNG
jgi:predicted RNA-binding protein YlxR (DUF448 family)